jgi:ribulose-phosphate 3-epimerase
MMSVNPGFGGQSFIIPVLDKIRLVRQKLDLHYERTGKRIILEVDGGIKPSNIADVAKAGANAFVAGSAIFGQKDYKSVIDEMNAILKLI